MIVLRRVAAISLFAGTLALSVGYMDGHLSGSAVADTHLENAGVSDSTEGSLNLRGPNGLMNVAFGSWHYHANRGAVYTHDEYGVDKAVMAVGEQGRGEVWTYGLNGQVNIAVNVLLVPSEPNNGAITVNTPAGLSTATIWVAPDGSGEVWAHVFSFRMADPQNSKSEIWYSALGGPEAAVYVRGTGRLVDGSAAITFPDHFRAVASEESMTVQLTPLSAESHGLATVRKGIDGIHVREMDGGRGSYDFDYLVTAVRKGHAGRRKVCPAMRNSAGMQPEDRSP